jgi:hypothetical protein
VYAPVLEIIEEFFAPEGKRDSAYSGDEMIAARKFFEQRGLLSFGDDVALSCEIPQDPSLGSSVITGSVTALLRVTTKERHPQLGSGVLMRLSMPNRLDQQEQWRAAVRINQLEATTFVRSHFLGAWCRDPDGTLTHVAFLPNALHQPGLLLSTVISTAVRARWAFEHTPDV